MAELGWYSADGTVPTGIEATTLLLEEALKASEAAEDRTLTELIRSALVRAARIGIGRALDA